MYGQESDISLLKCVGGRQTNDMLFGGLKGRGKQGAELLTDTSGKSRRVGNSNSRELQTSLRYLGATHYGLKDICENRLPGGTLHRPCSGPHGLENGKHPQFIVGPIRLYDDAATI